MLNVCAQTHTIIIRALRHVRSMLTADIAKSVACSSVNARLDYANSVVFGVTSKNITKLQMVQNTLARVVTGLQPRDHITPTLKRLHWLPLKSRIDLDSIIDLQNPFNQSTGLPRIPRLVVASWGINTFRRSKPSHSCACQNCRRRQSFQRCCSADLERSTK